MIEFLFLKKALNSMTVASALKPKLTIMYVINPLRRCNKKKVLRSTSQKEGPPRGNRRLTNTSYKKMMRLVARSVMINQRDLLSVDDTREDKSLFSLTGFGAVDTGS